MRKVSSILLILTAIFAAPLFAKDARKELTVNLKFAPQEGVDSNSADIPPAMLERPFELRVEDARGLSDALGIGQGTNDDDQTFPIRSGADVIPYIKETLQQVAGNWGMKSGQDGDRILTVRVARYFVEESNKAVGSMYSSEAKLAYILADRAGKTLAEGAASGEAHRYGRARSADNCNEVLSDALKEAFAGTLSDARLQSAWASGKSAASGSGSSQAQTKETSEERLRKLDELLKKGLITKEEYDKKRAEILKDL
jgi:putative oligomerization/nucleic acid binding protein